MIVLINNGRLVKEYEYKIRLCMSKLYIGVTICKITEREYKKQLIKGNVVNAGTIDWFLKTLLLSELPKLVDEITPEQYEEIENELLKH